MFEEWLADVLGFLAETPDRIEKVLRSMELPDLARDGLELIAEHPATTALVFILMAGALSVAAFFHFANTRRFEETLKEREASFPRRDWETMGRLDATRIIEEAQHLFALGHHREGTAAHDAVLGLLYLQRGDATRAERYLQQGIELFEQIGHREGVAFYSHYLSLLYRELGQPERAMVLAKRSSDLYRAIGRQPSDLARQTQTDPSPANGA